MGERQRRDRDRLSSNDWASLVDELVCAGVAKGAASAAASRALRAAFRGEASHGSTAAHLDGDALEAAGVGKAARAAIVAMHLAPSLALRDRAPSDDGAARLLFATCDGALVESVVIPGPRRVTLCVSTQVGCARACTFCETGTLGLSRGLSTAEIVDQVRLAAPIAREVGGGAPLSNLVFMGMGEPLDNLAEVGRAVRLLTDARAFAFAPSRVTVSTVGVVDKLEAFFRDVPAELAVSLNAPDDARRSRIMPVNDRFDLATLHGALARFVPPRRRVLLEYGLFDRFTDAPEDADLVADFTQGLRARVNVIPANDGPDPSLRAPNRPSASTRSSPASLVPRRDDARPTASRSRRRRRVRPARRRRAPRRARSVARPHDVAARVSGDASQRDQTATNASPSGPPSRDVPPKVHCARAAIPAIASRSPCNASPPAHPGPYRVDETSVPAASKAVRPPGGTSTFGPSNEVGASKRPFASTTGRPNAVACGASAVHASEPSGSNAARTPGWRSVCTAPIDGCRSGQCR